MKKLYIIGGTMGVGKTEICSIMNRKLEKSVFLDGDVCCRMDPFVMTDETQKLMMDNITFVLNNLIHCSEFDNIVFCWVMHEQAIIDELLSKIDVSDCEVHLVSLVCSENSLRGRLLKDIAAGLRTPEVIPRSVSRLPLYEALNTKKADITEFTATQAAEYVIEKC